MRTVGSVTSMLRHLRSYKVQVQSLGHGRQTSTLTTTTTKALLPDFPVRTRFAPSPTGNLHLGSIRTALFNYLLAKRTKGQFILRIEDTDQKRVLPGSEEQLCRDLRWAGLQWDEGPLINGPHGPYRQSERSEIYQAHAAKLLESKHAYRCFCSLERLDALNKSRVQEGLQLGYDRKCAHLKSQESDDRAHLGESHVIRLRAPDQYPPWHDFVYGKTGNVAKEIRKSFVQESVFDDAILVKSDGLPTYHLANVVDDHLMEISHVIRGSEWMTSTPLHLSMYKAFGWNPPLFGHVPLLVDQANQKLSKRNLDIDISSIRDKHKILPEALLNFAVLLGWSNRQKDDELPLRQLEQHFDLKFTKGNTVVSFPKLHYLQERHARRYIRAGGVEFQSIVGDVCTSLRMCEGGTAFATLGDRSLEDSVALFLRADCKSYTTPETFAQRIVGCLQPAQRAKSYEMLSPGSSLSALRVVAASLLLVPQQAWTADVHRNNIASVILSDMAAADQAESRAGSAKVWKKELYHFLRWSLTDGGSGPPLADLMEIMGKEICTERIQRAIRRSLAQEQVKRSEDPGLNVATAMA